MPAVWRYKGGCANLGIVLSRDLPVWDQSEFSKMEEPAVTGSYWDNGACQKNRTDISWVLCGIPLPAEQITAGIRGISQRLHMSETWPARDVLKASWWWIWKYGDSGATEHVRPPQGADMLLAVSPNYILPSAQYKHMEDTCKFSGHHPTMLTTCPHFCLWFNLCPVSPTWYLGYMCVEITSINRQWFTSQVLFPAVQRQPGKLQFLLLWLTK